MKTSWTKSDLARFDTFILGLSSPDQLTRIHRRLAVEKWKEEFSKKALDEMYAVLRKRDTRKKSRAARS